MDPAYASCRLTISTFELLLAGPPEALHDLASELENAEDDLVLSVSGGSVGLRRTASDLLKVWLDGTTLWVEGNTTARSIVVSALRGVAETSREVGQASVPRHEHIEYLGLSDDPMDPDSRALVVGADWPT